jgi:hypothetical protein
MRKILFIVPALIALAGIGIGVYAAINPQGVFEVIEQIGPGNLALYMPIGIIVIIALIMIPAFMPMIQGTMKGSKDRKRLLQTGQKRLVNIVNVQDTGMTVNNNPYVKITVETTSGNTATFQMMVPRIQIPRPGDKIEVLVDPADPTTAIPAK